MNFETIYTEATRRLGFSWNTMPSDTQALVKSAINQFRQEIVALLEPECYRRLWRFRTAGPYSTGTVSASAGSATITGNGTAWTADMVGRYIRFGSQSRWYEIRAVASATSLSIAPTLLGDDLSGESYEIAQLTVVGPPDAVALKYAWLENPARSIAIAYDKAFRESVPFYCTSGAPKQMSIIGTPNTQAYYSAGTVSVTAGSKTVAGIGTTWTAAMAEKFIRVEGTSECYRIRSVDDDTTLTLYETYRGPSASNQGYEIDPTGAPLIYLYPIPDDAYDVHVVYQYTPLPLYNEADVPEEPAQFHYVIVDYARLQLMRMHGWPMAAIENLENVIRARLAALSGRDRAQPSVTPLAFKMPDASRGPSYPDVIPTD